MIVHKSRDWVSKQTSIKREGFDDQKDNKTVEEKHNAVNQNSNFEPLASTIGGSRITFGDSLTDHHANESTVYY